MHYIHGSEDSLDKDIHYVVKKLPSFQECKEFCSENPNENRNLIVIEDGIVTDCFIGTMDEINNGLLDTYSLHEQSFPLLITKRLDRDVPIKLIRGVRGILSLLSKSKYRTDIKRALKGNFSDRIQCLESIDLRNVDFNLLNKQLETKHLLKVIAFQLGQCLGLLNGKEFYTKKSIFDYYPTLKAFLYREDNIELNDLELLKESFITYLKEIKIKENGSEIVEFLDYHEKFELRHETKLDY